MGFLVILLLFLPAVGAVVVACLGQERALLSRQISLGVTVAGAVIAVVLAIAFMANREESKDPRTYAPSFVPGAATAAPGKTTWNLIDFNVGRDEKAPKLGAIQFFVGIDGMNIWLIVLTSILMVSSV